ncbi:LLM class flavin-dependent oxidoreductase [Nocardioides carbamazepini]|uniref:LLM class flavin-dependent oxidoreductase n=1 Tax=Nocardioides carbamazepini TaxID=2854259 RepID=UPI00214A4CF0|nr:LLM class flavin-dependent oxidoreductase [Nocardioides carbamazepini]MCR1785670.1 LLM class flavin-dependent oxidoreductase [Nocardioides carbamazepini]
MHFSLHLSPQSKDPADDAEIIETLVETALRAERHGVASIGLTEHHLAGYNTYVDPFMLGAHLAGRLTTAHISVTVAQVALEHPVRLVEKCNLLDVLTRGRLLVALAAGSASPVELEAFGAGKVDRAVVTEERIEAMMKIWAREDGDPPLDVSTSVDRGVVAARVGPASYRLPRPLVARATRTPATIAHLGRQGIPVVNGQWLTKDGDNRDLLGLYADALFAGDFDEQTVADCLAWHGFGLTIVIAPTQRAAEERWARFLEVGGEGPQPGRLGGAAVWEKEWTHREVARSAGALVGSPQRIVEEIGLIREQGARHVRIIPAIPAGAAEDRDEIYDLIFEEVMSHVDPEPLADPVHVRRATVAG